MLEAAGAGASAHGAADSGPICPSFPSAEGGRTACCAVSPPVSSESPAGARVVGGEAGGCTVALAEVAGWANGMESAASSVKITEPWLTVSPSLIFISLTTPAWLEGISMLALSLSTVTRLCSALTVSPGLTSNSITATSVKSPMSGTHTSIVAIADFSFAPDQACSGLVFSVPMPYLTIAWSAL